MLEIKNLYAGYSGKDVLRSFELEAGGGEIVTILGKNGCGKSTLLKCLVGLLPVKSGEILIQGEKTAELKPRELAQRIAYLPQSKNLPDISAGRLVLHGRFPYLSYPRRYSKADQEIALAAMEQMGISELYDVPLAELSGGQRQKVYIAMALCQQAELIAMDEPTTYLDISQQMKFAALAKELKTQGKTLLLVLHDVLMALRISDKIHIIDEGKCLVSGRPEEVLESGHVQRLYGVSIGKTRTEKGTQYYYETEA